MMVYPALITALQNPAVYPHPVQTIQILQTHISWVILTGEFAYKIKKPVNLGFLDFSTLAQRQQNCNQELQLNRRLAAELYLAVVPITGSAEHPCFDPDGEIIEYAVKMRQFDPRQQFSYLIGQLLPQYIDQLADVIADFHGSSRLSNAEFGDVATIKRDCQENFQTIQPLLPSCQQPMLQYLQQWSEAEMARLTNVFLQRKKQGYVREVHGDMHLDNIALWNGKILIFDCIEFNAEFRNIDVFSDFAFTLMELFKHQQTALAYRLLDRYLQRSGDFAGLAVLRFYLVYRAMVRVKIALLQHGAADEYLALATSFTQEKEPFLLLTCGVSGSGKSYFSQALLERIGMIRLRSDVERKRMFGLAAHQSSTQDIYQSHTSKQLFELLNATAQFILRMGYPVIVDATFLKQAHRAEFITPAQQLGYRCVIAYFQVPSSVLEQRITQRLEQGDDASEATLAVLAQQQQEFEPLSSSEQHIAIAADSERVDEFIEALSAFR